MLWMSLFGFSYDEHYKFVTAYRSGIYQSLMLDGPDPYQHDREVRNWALDKNLAIDFYRAILSGQGNHPAVVGDFADSHFIALLYFWLPNLKSCNP